MPTYLISFTYERERESMRNKGVWVALGQSLGFMFSQHIDGSSCQIRNALKGSFKGTGSVSLLELDR